MEMGFSFSKGSQIAFMLIALAPSYWWSGLSSFIYQRGLPARNAMAEKAVSQDPFLDGLRASGPLASQADRMAVYAPLIGDWTVDVTDYAPDGSPRSSTGEWHFAWVLEGRAIQDVWIAPPRKLRRPGMPVQNNRYGTTVRVYDPENDVWNITWFNPVTGVCNKLVGRRQGNDIIHEGADADGSRIRWTFTEITTDSFRWRGERSTDGGNTWRLGAEFRGHRDRQGTAPNP
jgi:hypothetical protein